LPPALTIALPIPDIFLTIAGFPLESHHCENGSPIISCHAMLIFPLIEAFLNLSLWNNLLAFSAKFDTASTAFPEISAENFSIPDPISAISSLFSDLH